MVGFMIDRDKKNTGWQSPSIYRQDIRCRLQCFIDGTANIQYGKIISRK